MPQGERPESSHNNPRILAAQFRIKYRDIFNMQDLYRTLHEWIKDNQWNDIQDDTEGDAHESFYYDRTDLYGNKEIWAWWRMWQFPDAEPADTSNSFFRYHLDIDLHVLHLKEHEIMQAGKKIKTNTGEIEIKIWSWIELDYKGQWSKHPILKFFFEIFEARIFEHDLERHKHELYRQTYLLQNQIKQYLQLKTWLPQVQIKPFHHGIGVPEGQF